MAYEAVLIQQARDLWENKGYPPRKVIQDILDEWGIEIPIRTLRSWAINQNWKSWKETAQELAQGINPNVDFGVTGIRDPIFHLVWIRATHEVRPLAATLSRSAADVVDEVISAMRYRYRPGDHALEYMRPKLLSYVGHYRAIGCPQVLPTDSTEPVLDL